jgi:hypothetical protein
MPSSQISAGPKIAGQVKSVAPLLQRLDTALAKVMAGSSVVDEALPEIKRRQSP